MSLLDSTQLALEAAMRGSMQRQALLTNNLANVDTPGYEPEDVDFQSQLDVAMQKGQSPDQVAFQPAVSPQTTSADGNGVNPEQTEADISENGLLYSDLTQVAAAREGILIAAMGLSGGS